jgi:hypothetical protein
MSAANRILYLAKHLSYIVSLICTLVVKGLALSITGGDVIWHVSGPTYPKSICIEKFKKK